MYKFRFVTSTLLAEYRNVSSPVIINDSLRILVEKGYISRRYDNSYKLQGKGASYCLDSKGLSYLRDNFNLNKDILHIMYKNKSVNQAFIEHNLDVFRTALKLSKDYPKTFNLYTRYELGGFDYFPNPAPDIYLSRNKSSEANKNDYFLDIYSDTQFFIIKKRLALYIDHFESGDWEAEAETDYPAMLIACPDSRSEEKLRALAEKSFDSAGIDDLHIYTTTTKALLDPNPNNSAIWTKTSDETKTFDLNN
jgi:hypothetical protein